MLNYKIYENHGIIINYRLLNLNFKTNKIYKIFDLSLKKSYNLINHQNHITKYRPFKPLIIKIIFIKFDLKNRISNKNNKTIINNSLYAITCNNFQK